jgi:hypothetical protein
MYNNIHITTLAFLLLVTTSSSTFLKEDYLRNLAAYGPSYISSTYSASLNCGQCILSNYTYCVAASENNQITKAASDTCCSSSTCSQATSTSYNCSSSFTDTVYAKFVCPQWTSYCGSTQEFTLANISSNASISISSLPVGETCFYRVKA